MLSYPGLDALVRSSTPQTSATTFPDRVIPLLVDTWYNDYVSIAGRNEIVETTVESFSYLFDISLGRLIAAWGLSQGRYGGARDKSRMAGHPLSAGAGYHRGHAIPHTLGGPTDINLVAQQGKINVGPFRELERKAVATPGALYFTYWRYPRGDTQVPIRVEQGLLIAGRPPELREFAN
jgi:hypothetical protein